MGKRDRERKERIRAGAESTVMVSKVAKVLTNACSDCQDRARAAPWSFAKPDVPEGQTFLIYQCRECGTIQWKYPTKEQLGFPMRYAACKAKESFTTKAEAEKALDLANSWRHRCRRCGDVRPVSELCLEVYQCPNQKADWHLGPPQRAIDVTRTWKAATEEIVRTNWESKTPWEIAQEVNRFLAGQIDRDSCCFFHPITTQTGSGVVYKAWELGLVPSIQLRDLIREGCRKMAPKILNQPCPHEKRLKDCHECYFGIAPTPRVKACVVLYHESTGKTIVGQTDDLKAFMVEVKHNPQGYAVLAAKPLGEVDPVLREALGFESETAETGQELKEA
jgi:hypothetical protein